MDYEKMNIVTQYHWDFRTKNVELLGRIIMVTVAFVASFGVSFTL